MSVEHVHDQGRSNPVQGRSIVVYGTCQCSWFVCYCERRLWLLPQNARFIVHQTASGTGVTAAVLELELALTRAEATLSIQARAHALLKTKELELRTAKEDAQAEHAAELAIAQQELAAVTRDLSQACSASYVLHIA